MTQTAKRKLYTLTLALFSTLLYESAVTAATSNVKPPLSGQDMVLAADKVRNPIEPFRAKNVLTSYVKGVAQDEVTLTIYSKLNPQTGQYRNLISYVAPLRDAGKVVLLNGGQMWFFDPASEASVRLSPQQRLLGQASNGDVVTVNLNLDYRAQLIGQVDILDSNHISRGCWALKLSAISSEAVYNHIDYWLERGTYYPVKAKYYSDSGRLLKIAYFSGYQKELSGVRPTKIIILDGVDTNLVTTMNLSQFSPSNIPDAWFQRDFLPQFKPN